MRPNDLYVGILGKDLSDGDSSKFKQMTYSLAFSVKDLSDGDSSKFKQKTFMLVFSAKTYHLAVET